MNKLVLNSDEPKPKKATSIRISMEACKEIEKLCVKTGWSVAKIASKLIMFAAENAQIIGTKKI